MNKGKKRKDVERVAVRMSIKVQRKDELSGMETLRRP